MRRGAAGVAEGVAQAGGDVWGWEGPGAGGASALLRPVTALCGWPTAMDGHGRASQTLVGANSKLSPPG